MHARNGRSYWKGVVREFDQSGASHATFCASRGLNLATFRGWLYRTRRGEAASAAAVALVPVDVSRAAVVCDAPSAPIVVMLDGVEIAVTPGVDVAYVAALVAELRRC